MRISDLVRCDHTESTGLVLCHRGCFVFACGQEIYWQQGTVPIIGVGGKREPGESFAQAVMREAHEEAGVGIEIRASRQTWLFRPDAAPSTVDIEDRPRPLYIWDRPITLGAGVPARPYFCVVYQGVTRGDPAPSGEIPALVYVTRRGVQLLARGLPVKLAELLETGSSLQPVTDIPENAHLVTQGSAEYFFRHHQILCDQL